MTQPDSNEAPETLLRGWAKAYRDTPEHRFPSDPHAEFFPVDMEFAADEIAALKSRVEELRKALERIANENTHWNWTEKDTADTALAKIAVQMREVAKGALAPSLEQ